MTPATFPEKNFTFTKPENMTDEQCSSLDVFKGQDNQGMPVIISKWLPDEIEIAAITRGEGIYLCITGNGMPPVSLFTENPFAG